MHLSYYVGFPSGIARAFPCGRAAHPEDQNEEENKENWKKIWEKQQNEERLRKYSYIAQPEVRSWLRPWGFISLNILKDTK